MGSLSAPAPRTWKRKLPRQGDTAKGELLASDVGPVPRQCLTRIDDFFDSPDDLTLCKKLVGGQVPKRAVRPTLIVVHAPGFDDGLCLGERGELVHVQTFVSQSSVKRLNKSVFHGFSRSNEVELHTPSIGPIFQRA